MRLTLERIWRNAISCQRQTALMAPKPWFQANIHAPGTKFETMVVFRGEQGKGKSISLRKLFGPQWLVDTQQPKHKDQLIVLHSHW